MNLSLAFVSIICLFAAIPCALFLLNLLVYRRLPRAADGGGREARGVAPQISVLIPARNEEANLRPALEALLADEDASFEVVVLDDQSTDGTPEIVEEFAGRDARVRLASAPPLPAGWCGKQHACHFLSGLARGSLLVFLDADVRLQRGALRRISFYMERSRLDLASGVPRQELGTVSEMMLLPLIHFILLGYLPMHAMRWTRLPSMSGGCGQLFVARRDAYERSGGHAAIRESLHDGVKLPRVFRRAGFSTGLFDPTDLAVCRMYRSDEEVWSGLGKNAVEGLGAPGVFLPMSVFLLLGQVLPVPALVLALGKGGPMLGLAAAAVLFSLLPRWISCVRFSQPWSSSLLHPVAVIALLAIQWSARRRSKSGRASIWKGRRYPPACGETERPDGAPAVKLP